MRRTECGLLMISLFKIFLIFVKIGAMLLGGGYVILPVLISELSEKRNLVPKDDIITYYTLSQSVPGIIAANVSMFSGYRLRGVSGALVAILGVIFCPVLSIILIAEFLSAFENIGIVQAFLWGIGIAVIALIMLTVREMWRNSEKDGMFYVLFLSSLFALLLLNLSPVQVIILFTVFGVILKSIRSEKRDNS